MTTSKFANWLQILSNIGVIIGILLVFQQMRQNEQLTRLEIINSYYQDYMEYEATLSDAKVQAFAKALQSPNDLTLSDMRHLESTTFVPLNRWINLYRLAKAGLIEDQMWQEQVRTDVGFYFANAYGLAWWHRMADLDNIGNIGMTDYYLPPELKNFITQELSTTHPDDGLIYFQDIKEGIAKILMHETLK